MREKLARFMMGRYGVDTLGKFNLGVVLVLIVINMFVGSGWLYWLGLLCGCCLLAHVFEKYSKALQ